MSYYENKAMPLDLKSIDRLIKTIKNFPDKLILQSTIYVVPKWAYKWLKKVKGI